ncbi:MAG: helix-turn-helix transcriptional regulator [Bacteroidales bacterium]|nr:helix-turn-helix transcriptional regulator [Bacteroidales bacterium]
MKNFEIAINERVIEAINHILSSKIESNKAVLAEKFGVKPAKFSEILNKRMKAGMDIIQKLCINYGISADWLITGEGDMLRSDGSEKTSSPPGQAEVIRLLREKIADQQEIIDLLKDKIELLQGGSAGDGDNMPAAAAG